MSQPSLQRHLGLWSAVLLVIGSVIGSGIFMKPYDICRALPDETWILGGWAILGAICLFGALAYGELGAMFPQAGGQYAFLREAYGPFVAFLYGWCLLLVINTGTLAALCLVFAKNVNIIVPMSQGGQFVVAASMVVVLGVVNHFGVRWGTLLQNVSTVAKLLALGAIVVTGFVFAGGGKPLDTPESFQEPDLVSGLVAAAVALFWAYEGWHQLAFSAAEMKRPEKDTWRALTIGILALVLIYVLVNVAYLNVVPIEDMRRLADESQVPRAAVDRMFGDEAGALLAALICLSVFGAANPNLLSTPRAFYAMAHDRQVPSILMRVHPRWRTPHVAIWFQAGWAVLLVWVLGTFRDITEFVVFAALLFYALVVAGVYVLRAKLPDRERPYRCWGYPVTPAVFIATVLLVDVRLVFFEDTENALYGLAIMAVIAMGYAARGLSRRARQGR